MNYKLTSYALQDIGKRSNQEDYFYPPFLHPCHYDNTKRDWSFYDGTPRIDDRFFMVCDGMGGHERGEVASETVVLTISNYMRLHSTAEGPFTDDIFRGAVDKAIDALIELDDPKEERKMGTTLTMLKFHADGATIGHIGDSRVYQFRPAQNGHTSQILFKTGDHTMVNDMLERGQLTAAQASSSPRKHILSRAITATKNYRPEVEMSHITDIRPNDVFLLCSDGMYENLDDSQLCQILCDPNDGDAEHVQTLLHESIDNKDNHTAIVVRILDVYNKEDEVSSPEILQPGVIVSSKNYSYHIEKMLGQGAFGITYLANTSISMQGQLGTIHTEVKMALKEFFMHKEMRRQGTFIEKETLSEHVKQFADKFRSEAAKLAMLSHPHIVNILEVFEANNTIYYSMENLTGGTLGNYVNKNNGMSEKNAIKCIRQVGSALSYMHANRMLHLDVKPGNIMLADGLDNIKLIDFGLAKSFEDNGEAMTSSYLGSGTSGYAPIEQLDGSKSTTFAPQIDVYALGATYYKLLTARVPDSAIDILNKGLYTLPLVKRNVSQESINAIKAAMEPMIGKRLKSVKEFLDMLPSIDDDTIFERAHQSLWSRFIALWK